MNSVSHNHGLPGVQAIRPVSRDGAARRRPSQPVEDDPAMTVSLSPEARAAQAADNAREAELSNLQGRLPRAQARAEHAQEDADEAMAVQRGEVLSEDEERYVSDLRARDAEVRTHEAGHVAAAGGHAGLPQYTTEVGPDGRQYVVGGRVSIDLSSAGSPEATADKMRTIKAAASAVSSMSGADMRVAAKAERSLQEALRQRASKAYASAADGRF